MENLAEIYNVSTFITWKNYISVIMAYFLMIWLIAIFIYGFNVFILRVVTKIGVITSKILIVIGTTEDG